MTFFDKRLGILNQFIVFTQLGLLYIPIYARLQNFIHLSQTVTYLCGAILSATT